MNCVCICILVELSRPLLYMLIKKKTWKFKFCTNQWLDCNTVAKILITLEYKKLLDDASMWKTVKFDTQSFPKSQPHNNTLKKSTSRVLFDTVDSCKVYAKFNPSVVPYFKTSKDFQSGESERKYPKALKKMFFELDESSARRKWEFLDPVMWYCCILFFFQHWSKRQN